jgi:Tfp pilus assembly protein PilF
MDQMTQTLRYLGVVSVCSLPLALSGCGATSGWVMNNSGMGYYQQGQYAMARHEFAQAVAAAPWNADYRHNLAMALKQMGDVTTAERVLRHNLTVNVMHQPTYHSLAQLLNEQGRQGEALELVQTWSETQPYLAAAHIELAWLQREMGNLPDAERELRQALQVEPQNPIALAHLGSLYQDMGETHYAAQLYQRSLAVNWNQPQVQTRLAALAPAAGMQPAMNPASLAQLSYGMNPMPYGRPVSPYGVNVPPYGMPAPGMPGYGAPAYGPAAGMQIAARMQLPPPLFDQAVASPPASSMPNGAFLATTPAPHGSIPMNMGPANLPAGMPLPPGAQVVTSPAPLPPGVPVAGATVPPETIVIPANGALDMGPVLLPAPDVAASSTAVPAGTTITATKPLPSSGWQPITQTSAQADPAHVPAPSPLPSTTAY